MADKDGGIFDDKKREEVRKALARLTAPVRLIFFTQRIPCPNCKVQEDLLRELAALSGKVQFETFRIDEDAGMAERYGIDKVPATLVLGKRDNGMRFFGLTLGQEFPSLLTAMLMASNDASGFSPEMEAMVRAISRDVHIQVFVTLTCPYCPRIVHAAHQFAFVSDRIRADMVETSEFPTLVQRYDVYGVPRTVINETHAFDGAVPAETLYLEILKAVDPAMYQRIDEMIREAQGTRKVRKADPGHEYEVLVVGGGPAALSAAVYAVRKGLDVAIVADRLGGQVTTTGAVDNYLGLPEMDGSDLAEAFAVHMERNDVAESVGSAVADVRREGNVFAVTTEDGKVLRGRSLIYCAGKEYRRLGVPNEAPLIGRGIGFCANCDAPLYRGKRVAVIGGGNSAFTTARDLLRIADEIHLIHRRTEFTADEVLVRTVTASPKVHVHAPRQVKAFLGKDRLTGVRITTPDGSDGTDLLLDGAFLEIGLTPNSSPLRGLVRLNELGEVPTGRDQSTEVPGLFAAGDVTDVRDKQISVAVGQGAAAAISAYEFLFHRGLTRSTVGKDEWQ